MNRNRGALAEKSIDNILNVDTLSQIHIDLKSNPSKSSESPYPFDIENRSSNLSRDPFYVSGGRMTHNSIKSPREVEIEFN
jgi:hypothetical protein